MLKARIGVGMLVLFLTAVVVAGAQTAAPAAPAAGAQGGGRFAGAGGGGRGGNFDPAAMREQMMQRMKDTLGVSDQDWTAIEPKLSKVMDLSRELQPARMGRGGRGGAPAAAAPAAPQNDVEKARAALQAAVDDAASTPEVIKAKLAALRDAKEKVRQDLDKATTDLKSVLTNKQEAQLVLAGMLE